MHNNQYDRMQRNLAQGLSFCTNQHLTLAVLKGIAFTKNAQISQQKFDVLCLQRIKKLLTVFYSQNNPESKPKT